MSNQHYRLGSDVFEKYSPYYDSYRGHIFIIDHYHYEKYPEDNCDDHVWLKCIDMPELKMGGYVELFNLVPVIFLVVYSHPWSIKNQVILRAFENYEEAKAYREEKIEEYVERNKNDYSLVEEAQEWYENVIKLIDVDFKK